MVRSSRQTPTAATTPARINKSAAMRTGHRLYQRFFLERCFRRSSCWAAADCGRSNGSAEAGRMVCTSAPHRSQKRSLADIGLLQIGQRFICGCADRLILLESKRTNASNSALTRFIVRRDGDLTRTKNACASGMAVVRDSGAGTRVRVELNCFRGSVGASIVKVAMRGCLFRSAGWIDHRSG